MEMKTDGETLAADPEEESTTLSWTSSMASLSPDHPLFHGTSGKSSINGVDVLGKDAPVEENNIPEGSETNSISESTEDEEDEGASKLRPTPDLPENQILPPFRRIDSQADMEEPLDGDPTLMGPAETSLSGVPNEQAKAQFLPGGHSEATHEGQKKLVVVGKANNESLVEKPSDTNSNQWILNGNAVDDNQVEVPPQPLTKEDTSVQEEGEAQEKGKVQKQPVQVPTRPSLETTDTPLTYNNIEDETGPGVPPEPFPGNQAAVGNKDDALRFDAWPVSPVEQQLEEYKPSQWQNNFAENHHEAFEDDQPLGLDDDDDDQLGAMEHPVPSHRKQGSFKTLPHALHPSPIAEERAPIEEDTSRPFPGLPVLEKKEEEEVEDEEGAEGRDEARPLVEGFRFSGSDLHSLGRSSPPPQRLEPSGSPLRRSQPRLEHSDSPSSRYFCPLYASTRFYESISKRLLRKHYTPFAAATWIGFWALLHVTCANYVLTPMRDAIALSIGVQHMPKLTLASTALAFCSSVPIGWLFEAPDPNRRRVWKRMGLTRGETQGTSLALFYRCFAGILVSYAVGFALIELLRSTTQLEEVPVIAESLLVNRWLLSDWLPEWNQLWTALGQFLYIAFFLVVHLMKLHSLSLVWGVTTEAIEYEEVARKRSQMDSNKTRLQRLALVGFGGTLGGILGSGLASSMARLLRLPGLLILAALLLEISAELSIELGRIMQKHWEEQQLFKSTDSLASLDASMKRSVSLGSMKRVASGNSLNRIKSTSDLNTSSSASTACEPVNDNTFIQRLLRGVRTILKSRLLMAIFTYNALYASTTVLLSFQRAALVANRNESTTTEADTAFLANVNMASSVAIFALQASGLGAMVAAKCGPRGTLALMPAIRLLGVLSLAWWHQTSNGQPPNLLIFLVVDEATKIMNLAVAKPVRESLWRGLSNEARYEAKPIVDTLANRWGGGSAAFLVSFINKALDLFGVEPDGAGSPSMFGFPPILFLCMIIASWWTAVSADLGQIRSRIDMELKKCQ